MDFCFNVSKLKELPVASRLMLTTFILVEGLEVDLPLLFSIHHVAEELLMIESLVFITVSVRYNHLREEMEISLTLFGVYSI